jgi:hypothetical protein
MARSQGGYVFGNIDRTLYLRIEMVVGANLSGLEPGHFAVGY